MADWFSLFYVEQSTPDEVVVFLVLGTLAALVVAFTLYALILVALWRWRMAGKGRLRSILLPSRKRLKANLGEYLLASTTALLLTFSVAARHDVVQAVLEQPVESLNEAALRDVLHIDSVNAGVFRAAGASDAVAEAVAGKLSGRDLAAAEVELLRDISVRDFVHPMLRAGLPDNASRLLLTSSLALQGRTATMPTRGQLLFAAATLLLFFVGWSGWRRIRELQVAESEPDWSALAKRLSVPALCVPLLLVSAAAADNPERITRAAHALAMIEAADTTAPRTAWINDFVTGEVVSARLSPDSVTRRIRGMSVELGSHRSSFDSVKAQLDDAARRLRAADSSAASVERRIAALQQRLASDSAAAARTHASIDARIGSFEGRLSALNRLDTLAAETRLARDDARRAVALVGVLNDSINALRQATARELSLLSRRLPAVGHVLIVGIGGDGDYRASGPTPVSGNGTGLHELRPGSYTVTGNGARTESLSVAAGRAYTVRLRRAQPPPIP
jgi:hypothetical protein